jgi:hypothetical protein
MLPYSYLQQQQQQQQQQLDAGLHALSVGGIKGCCFSTLPGLFVETPLLPSQQQQQLGAGPRALGTGVIRGSCLSTLPGRSEELPSLPLQQQQQQQQQKLDEAAPAAASASSKDETFKQGDLLAEGRCVALLATSLGVCITLYYCAPSHSIRNTALLTRTRTCGTEATTVSWQPCIHTSRNPLACKQP